MLIILLFLLLCQYNMSSCSYYVLDFFNEHDTLILENFCLINLSVKSRFVQDFN